MFWRKKKEFKRAIPEFIKRMRGHDYIDKSREYLDYIEEHLDNVAAAFNELSEACNGKEAWVGDDFSWWSVKAEVEGHDLSKFTKEEFVQYRDNFFPVSESDKEKNHHHHETAANYIDLIHMVIDWMAMSYKFGDSPRGFYLKTKPEMKLDDDQHAFVGRLFDHLESYRARGN